MPLKYFITILFIAVSLSIQSQELSSFKWNNRLVIIADTSPSKTNSTNQIELFKEYAGELKERDVLLFLYDGKVLIDTEGKYSNLILPKEISLKNSELLLIGKDGYIKMRSALISDPLDVFQKIDQMPMRQSEVKKEK